MKPKTNQIGNVLREFVAANERIEALFNFFKLQTEKATKDSTKGNK